MIRETRMSILDCVIKPVVFNLINSRARELIRLKKTQRETEGYSKIEISIHTKT